ncbi:GntR family transcriptional regulator [Micropruina sonneratiae]|uniref:GntR family transcriptional regulator n=1 Tax=Micropruina sonneratiae TaxID=2986940 RepID=UPI002227C9DC|nr:GntR family transcriptional regulator [Micropruina sp. KQZ13P-5]MCW3157815.1 GntR family transcriptional regulator [Micropruina sp. KQZ13P-5]
MLIRIDPASDVPLYEQLAASVRAQLAAGSIAAGERLPGARDLAQSLGINLHTVLRGYNLLRDEGLLELRRGRGAVVAGSADAVSTADRATLAAALEEVRRAAQRLGLSADELATLVTKGYGR